jgi:hypothetical protein
VTPRVDANGDGVKNLLEFAMGQNPLAFTARPKVGMEGGETSSSLLVRCRSRPIVATFAADLSGAGTTDGVADLEFQADGDLQTREARFNLSGSGGFLRLEVTQPDAGGGLGALNMGPVG